jgi:hypothetical protein
MLGTRRGGRGLALAAADESGLPSQHHTLHLSNTGMEELHQILWLMIGSLC